MKVLYLATGMPHYFNLVLNRISATPDVELVVAAPKRGSRYVGEGVYETREGLNFRVIDLEEYTVGRWYTSYRRLPSVILRERPDVIVLPEQLSRGFLFRPALWLVCTLLRVRLVLKSIPFRLPDYATSLQVISSRRGGAASASYLKKLLFLLQPSSLAARAKVELRRFVLRMMDGHVNYVDAAKEILGSYGVPTDRIFVTRNSPDTEALRKTERTLLEAGKQSRRSPFRLLHVGRLVPQKGVDVLLKALPEVCAAVSQTEVVIVGGGPEKERFAALAVELGVAHAVRLVGPIYDPLELGRHFLSSSIFVLPGLGGLSINEAMFYRQAVVCSVGDGTERHLVREGHNGAFFRENDPGSLAAVLIRLMSDSAELVRMGERSRVIIDNEVNIDTVVAEYVRAFRFVCGNRQGWARAC